MSDEEEFPDDLDLDLDEDEAEELLQPVGHVPQPMERIQRRVSMPIPMWTEVLDLANAGGLDVQDAVSQLIDLGIQAQDRGLLKPRFFGLSKDCWERVSSVAKKTMTTEEAALVRLVDLGLQSRVEDMGDRRPLPTGTPTRIEFRGRVVAQVTFPTVPVKGEVVSIVGKNYVVEHRAWSVSASGRATAFLRVVAYPGGRHA